MRRSIARHALLASALVVGTVHVVGSIHSGDLPGNGDSWALGLTAMGQAALGWTIVGWRPQLRIGWLMLCGGLVGTTTYLASWWAQDTLVTQSGSLPFGPFAAWWATWSAPLPIALVVVVPLVLFPTGIARSRRWRAFLVAVTVVLTGLVIGSAVLAALVAARTPLQLVEVAAGPVASRRTSRSGSRPSAGSSHSSRQAWRSSASCWHGGGNAATPGGSTRRSSSGSP